MGSLRESFANLQFGNQEGPGRIKGLAPAALTVLRAADRIPPRNARRHERTNESIRTDTASTSSAPVHSAAGSSGNRRASTASAHLHAAAGSASEEKRDALGSWRLWLPYVDHHYLRGHCDAELPSQAKDHGVQERL